MRSAECSGFCVAPRARAFVLQKSSGAVGVLGPALQRCASPEHSRAQSANFITRPRSHANADHESLSYSIAKHAEKFFLGIPERRRKPE